MAEKNKECDFVVKRLKTLSSQWSSSTITNPPPNWSELPSELLSEVLSHLLSFDQVRFRAVCQNWKQLPTCPHHNDDLPWVVDYSWSALDARDGMLKVRFILFEPWFRTPYAVDELTSQVADKKAIRTVASKKGWLFFMLKSHTSGLVGFILFSPFTKQTIKLPDLVCGTEPDKCRGTFSSDPMSPDCAYFVTLEYFGVSEKSMLCMYRRAPFGTATWTTRTPIGHSVGHVEFIGGAFCCIEYDGTLRRYHPEHNLLALDRSPLRSIPEQFLRFSRLIDHRGDILNVTFSSILGIDMQFKVYILDQLTKRWVQKEWFPTSALFIGRSTSFMVAAIGARSDMANKIFYHRYDGEIKFYSFEDKRNHICGRDKPHCDWIAEKDRIDTWLQPLPLPP